MQANLDQKNFRVFGPDETASNRLSDVITGTGKAWMAETLPVDEEPVTHRACDGSAERTHVPGLARGLSAHRPAWILLCYEAFIHIVDSMVNQHAKWLKVTREIPWRKPIASLNYLLSSLVWRQDHNGFSHQDPGFIDHLLNKKADVVRIYLPPDANTLLSVARPLPAQPQLHQLDRRRQAARAAVAHHRRSRRALHHRPRHLEVGIERWMAIRMW